MVLIKNFSIIVLLLFSFSVNASLCVDDLSKFLKKSFSSGNERSFIVRLADLQQQQGTQALLTVSNKFKGNEQVEAYEQVLSESDFFRMGKLTKGDAKKINSLTMDYLAHKELPSTTSTRLPGVNFKMAGEIQNSIINHPIVSLNHSNKYDPDDLFGFCWGRAMAVHLETLARGIQKNKIMKLWATGSFDNGSGRWRYHVTTIVKAYDGSWWTIDPLKNRPVSVEDWLKWMQSLESSKGKGLTVVYATEAKRFSPMSGNKYDPSRLSRSTYNSYFSDLLKSYRDHDGGFSGPRLKP